MKCAKTALADTPQGPRRAAAVRKCAAFMATVAARELPLCNAKVLERMLDVSRPWSMGPPEVLIYLWVSSHSKSLCRVVLPLPLRPLPQDVRTSSSPHHCLSSATPRCPDISQYGPIHIF